jgi:tripartite-type tricarboxylate transporter receptor subunit TctC
MLSFLSKRLRGAFITAALAALSTSCAFAQAPFYQGKTLTIMVGFPPGGGYDIYARVLARYMGRHIPGEPQVIVQNMPGAGSLNLANHLYTLAPKDGTVIGSIETAMPFEAFFNPDAVRFDPLKFTWLIGLNSEITTCFVRSDSPIKSFSDLFTREAKFGATNSGATPVVEPRVANALLGAKIAIVSGYPGTQDIFLAIERGEVEGACGVGWTALNAAKADWVRDGKIRILAQNATKRHPAVRDVPLLLDFAKTDEQRQLLELLAAPQDMGRPILAPPDIPLERRDILRKALEETVADPAFLADATKAGLFINPVRGADIEAVLARIGKMDRALIARMTALRQ